MPDAADAGRGGLLFVYGEKLRSDVDRVTGGGGEKFHPFTANEARVQLASQVAQLRDALGSLPESLRGPRLVFQTTLLPNYLAASYFPSQLFNELDLVPLGSRSARAPYVTRASERDDAPTKSVIVAGTADSVRRLESLVTTGGRDRSERAAVEQFREISEVRLATPDEVLGTRPEAAEGDRPLWEAVLHPGASSRGPSLVPIDEQTFAKWVRLIASLSGEVIENYRRTVGGLTFVPVRLDAGAVADAAQFNPLRSLRPMPTIRPIPGILRATHNRVAAPALLTPGTDVRIAIFDGGVETSHGLFPTCTVFDEATEPPVATMVGHGSAVTGCVLFGNIEVGDVLRQPAAHVDHYRVLPLADPLHDPDAYWVLDRIEEVFENAHYPIVNLSLGPSISVEDSAEPNRWTSTLDQIAYERDVLFVVAAGNNGEEDAATGLNKVQVPADMANGLSVGACDQIAPNTPWGRSAFSAIGPGRAGSRVQPSGVQFGGGQAKPITVVAGDGTLNETAGTSFAAPLVVHSLVRLTGSLGADRSTPNVCRAFAVHLAEPHPDFENVVNDVGHGRFLPDFDSALECNPNEILVLYSDQIARDEVQGLAIPLPLGVDSGYLDVAWTLSFTAPTEPTQPTEYTQATIEPVFRPHDQKFNLTNGPKKVLINVAEEPEKVAELFAAGFTASSVPASFSMPGVSGTEDERREAGKWDTLRHFRRRFQARSLRNPRLELTYIAREGGLLVGVVPPLDYALVVSIHAKAGINLYELTRAEFPELSPLDIALTTEARV